MSQEAIAAYTTNQRQDESVRDTEAHALLSCANRLEIARQPDCGAAFFNDALHHNQQLWTLFQACLCESDNPLPREIKTLLLNLSIYIDKVTFQAISEGNPDLLSSLITINRNIAAGLRKNAEMQTPSTQQPSRQQTMTQPTSYSQSTTTSTMNTEA